MTKEPKTPAEVGATSPFPPKPLQPIASTDPTATSDGLIGEAVSTTDTLSDAAPNQSA